MKNIKVVHLPLTMRKKKLTIWTFPPPPPIVCRLHKKRQIGVRAYSYIFLFKTEQEQHAKSENLRGKNL